MEQRFRGIQFQAIHLQAPISLGLGRGQYGRGYEQWLEPINHA